MMIDLAPATCPHGAGFTPLSARYASVAAVYVDGCRTASGSPRRFWCGLDEMCKPTGVSITEGEYLAAWDEALEEARVDALHEVALAEDERLTAETHPDTPETREYLRSLYTPCLFRGLISKRPCILPAGHDESHDVWSNANAEYANSSDGCDGHDAWIKQAKADTHAEYLGEVPWTDRVDD